MFENARIREENMDLKNQVENLKLEVKGLEADAAITLASHERQVADLKADHEIALKRAQAEALNAELKAANEALARVVEVEKENARLTEKCAQMERMVDINGDIYDVKELVKGLIGALPKVNISGGVTVARDGKCE